MLFSFPHMYLVPKQKKLKYEKSRPEYSKIVYIKVAYLNRESLFFNHLMTDPSLKGETGKILLADFSLSNQTCLNVSTARG